MRLFLEIFLFFDYDRDSITEDVEVAMDIQHLKYFVEVVRQESFTRAAAQLFVTQPMLTRSIKQLEESLNVLLIERTSKSFHLTDAGRILYERAQEFLMQYEAIFQTMADVRSVKTGEVRLSIPGVLLDMYFPELFASFHRQYPGIDISLVEEGSKLVASSVGSGRADLGLVMLPVDEPYRFESKTLISNVCSLVVSRHHPFAKMSSVHIRDLKDETILTYSETATLHDTFIRMCGECGFVPRISYKSLMTRFCLKMVGMQQCIAVLPLPILQPDLCEELVTVPLEPVIPWEIAIIRRREGYRSFAANQLFSHICDHFASLDHQGMNADLRATAISV